MDLDQLFTVTDYQSTTISIPCSSTNNKDNNERLLTMELYSSPAACTDFDLTGQILWPVSNLLSHFLASQADKVFGNKEHIVELGAGCGLPGLVAAKLGAARVLLTDGNEVVLDLLQQNVDAQTDPPSAAKNIDDKVVVSARQVIWGDRDHCQKLLRTMDNRVDHVVAADVVQWPAVVEPLLHTVKALLWNSKAQEPSLFLGIVNRASSTYDLFFSLADDLGFSYRRVPATEFLEEGIVPDSCQEMGGRKAEIYVVTLTDKSQHPILLQDSGENIILGKNYENTSTLPC